MSVAAQPAVPVAVSETEKKTNRLMALLQMPSVAVLLVWMIIPC